MERWRSERLHRPSAVTIEAIRLVTKCDDGWVETYQLPTFRSIGGAVLVANSYSDCHWSRIRTSSTRLLRRSWSRYGSCVVCWTLPVSSRIGDVGVWPPKPTSTRNSCGVPGRDTPNSGGLCG